MGYTFDFKFKAESVRGEGLSAVFVHQSTPIFCVAHLHLHIPAQGSLKCERHEEHKERVFHIYYWSCLFSWGDQARGTVPLAVACWAF